MNYANICHLTQNISSWRYGDIGQELLTPAICTAPVASDGLVTSVLAIPPVQLPPGY
jgi:hypothetical protein